MVRRKLKVLWSSRASRYTVLFPTLWTWRNCQHDGRQSNSQWTKNKFVCAPRSFCMCFSVMHGIPEVVSSPWTKHSYTSTHLKVVPKHYVICGQSAPKKANSPFWKSSGDSFFGLLKNGQLCRNGAHHASLLDCLKYKLQENGPSLTTRKIILYYGNTPIYSSAVGFAK